MLELKAIVILLMPFVALDVTNNVLRFGDECNVGTSEVKFVSSSFCSVELLVRLVQVFLVAGG